MGEGAKTRRVTAGRSGARGTAGRAPLSRERVIRAAVAVAGEKGVAALSMRAVAGALGVEAMSLYHHVPGKEDLLDGMVDAVFGEIDLPPAGTDWADAMRHRAGSARAALLRHPWAVALMDSRGRPGPATLRHHDAVLGALRAGGFSVEGAAHAVSLIDSYLYGFVIQELSTPFRGPAESGGAAAALLRELPGGAHPHLAEVAAAHAGGPGPDHDREFAFGLGLILDALRRYANGEPDRPGGRAPGGPGGGV
jgi:AcrR family transcriptional regulator